MMEKDKFFMNEGSTTLPTAWNSSIFGMEIQANELNCSSEQLPPNYFFNPNWDNSMDQSDPFESALSSIVSSPANSNAGIPIPGNGGGGENIVLRELIGRLGSICNSGEISPQSYINNGSNSTNTSCYNTPLNSPPKLNLSMMDHQIRGNLPSLSPFATDPGFAERAARYSSFGGRTFGGLLNGQVGLKESEFHHRMESGNLSRVSSNQSFKLAGSQAMGVHQENKDGSMLQDGIPAPDKKFSRLSRPSTPENTDLGDSMEESSVSEPIPGGDIGIKAQNDTNAKKRKSIPRGKAKETSLTPSAKDAKVAGGKEESNAKRSKPDEEAKEDEKANGDGNQKQTKESAKPVPEPPKDYIHVRARRGQATDSHSLAERVRREKISERMKFLQDLVPGCNKVTGKAVMLDEIINYVQSLQRQVEFLSMKLATVNPRMDISMEALLSKDIFQSRGSTPHNSYPLDTSAQPFPYAFQSQHGDIPTGTEQPFSMNSLTAAIHRNSSMKLSHMDGFPGAASQASAFWEDDLQSIVQMGLGQNQPQIFQGTMSTGQMKVEL